MKSNFWFISFIIYFGLLFIWIYSIGRILNKNNSKLIKRMNVWWILYSLSLIPFALNFRNIVTNPNERIDSWIIILGGIAGLVAIIKIIIYSVKTLKRAELNKEYKTTSLVSEIFFIYFFIIGIWTLQPRLNKLMEKKEVII